MLPSLNARKILKDKYGFIWAATQDGIYRFDGKRHVLYNNGPKNGKYSLIGTDFFDILFDSTGNNLWALSGVGGLNKINIETGAVIGSVSIPELFGGNIWAKCMFIRQDNIYIGTAEGLILKYDISLNIVTVVFSFKDNGKASYAVENILGDRNNNIWFLISGVGVFCTDYEFKDKRLLRTEQLFNTADVQLTDCVLFENFIIITSFKGVVVVNTKSGRIASKNSLFEKKIVPYLSNRIDCVTVWADSIFFAGPNFFFAVNMTDKIGTRIVFSQLKDDQKWLLYTSTLLYDDGSIWVGGQYGTAIVKSIKTPFTGYYNSFGLQGDKLGHCYGLLNSRGSDEIACTDEGVYSMSLKDGILKKISKTNLYYSAIYITRKLLLCSGDSGTDIFTIEGQNRKISEVFPELGVLEKDQVTSMVSLGDSLFFFAGLVSKKIYCWNKVLKKTEQISQLPGFAKGFTVNRLFIDSLNRLWIIFDGSVSIYNLYNHKVEDIDFFLRSKIHPLRINMDICEVGGGFWIASYGLGLVKVSKDLKKYQTFSIRDGMDNIGLYRVSGVGDSLIVASSNNGITELNTHTNKIRNFFEEEGLHGNYFEQFSGDKRGDTIFFGGMNGFTMIDAKKLNFIKTYPRIYITSVDMENGQEVRDTFNLQLKKLEIPSDVVQVSVNFSAINYISPDKDSFAYRILEVNKQWVSLGNQRSAKLIGLSPGKYTIQIRNAQRDDPDLAKPVELTLIFLPKWYQTLWFDFAVAMAVIGLLYSFFRYRIGQLKKQQQIRAEIASDLHDDIGSALNTVKVFTHLAKRDEDKMKHINQIEDSVTEAAIGLRDMLWILDDSQDTVQEMLERIKKFALPVAMANGITLECINDAANDSQQISTKTKKRNLLLIAKESINNSIKYADCKNIHVTLSQKNNKVTLVIKDDGKGFDMATVQKGYGLSNIQHRAKQIKAVAEIVSAQGQGTTVTVKQN